MKITTKFILPVLLCCVSSYLGAQLTATFNTTINTKCEGSDCDYSGPSILINEMMMSPSSGDGSLSGTDASQRGEWIELYNPNICEPIDISCYYLGSNFGDPNTNSEAFILPQGTIVPPGGFCVVRGVNAVAVPANKLVQNGGNTIEIIMPATVSGDNICVQGGSLPINIRFWFPNSGGWFAFYDRNGVPQDAVKWATPVSTNSAVTCIPSPSSCNNTVTQLSSWDNIPSNRKTNVWTTGAIANSWGQTIRRMPDGGSWSINQGTASYTIGDCNDVCATLGSSSCDGTAKVMVAGGSGNYSYAWNDAEGQLTQTATGLCAGTYQVVVTDLSNNQSQTFSVTVDEYVPTVTFGLDTTICNNNQTIAITGFSPVAGAGQTGTFSGTGVTGGNFSVATSGNGAFPITYQFTDENGCTNSAVGNIAVNPIPTPTISGIDSEYCLSDVTIQPVLTPTGGTLSGPGVSGNSFNILVAGVGVHTLTYEVTQNGCTGTTTFTVTVTGTTPPVFSVQEKVCLDGDPVALSGTPTGGTFTVNGQTITAFNPADYTVGDYTIFYNTTDPNNPECLAQSSDTITVLPLPQISTNTPTFFCFGTPDYPVVMSPAGGQLSGGLVVGNSLQISDTAGSFTFTYDYTSPDGCSNSYTHSFTVQNELKVSFTSSQDCFQNITLTAVPEVGTFNQYQWSDGSTTIGNNQNSITENIPVVGTHTFNLIATSAQGCKANYSEVVDIAQGITAGNFQIPNIITANNDGNNDVITMPLMDEDCINYQVLIMNRWGNLVYTCDKNNPTFSGKTQGGKLLDAGVYFYKLVSDDFDCSQDPYKPRCHGFITIVR